LNLVNYPGLAARFDKAAFAKSRACRFCSLSQHFRALELASVFDFDQSGERAL
jgi:hypothetical protein